MVKVSQGPWGWLERSSTPCDPNAGLTPDGFSKYIDTNLSVGALPNAAHLCYIEQQPAADAAVPRTALGVTNGSLEWSIGAIGATDAR